MAVPNTFTDGTVAYSADVNENFTNIENYLGYAEITTPFQTAATPTVTDVTNLAVTVTVPSGGRKVKITAWAYNISTSSAATTGVATYIYEGVTCLSATSHIQATASYSQQDTVIAVKTPSAGSHTYKVAVSQSTAGTLTLQADATYPAFILVEQI